MAKVRDILGHVQVEIAQRKRICHRNRRKHSIAKGECCLVIKDAGGASKNYCHECAAAILTQAEANLDAFREAFI